MKWLSLWFVLLFCASLHLQKTLSQYCWLRSWSKEKKKSTQELSEAKCNPWCMCRTEPSEVKCNPWCMCQTEPSEVKCNPWCMCWTEPSASFLIGDPHAAPDPARETTQRYDRAVSHFDPSVWNSLPLHIRNAPAIDTFKSTLKTYLFNLQEFVLLSPVWCVCVCACICVSCQCELILL